MALISTARLGVRALQTLFALLAMIFTSVGYIKNKDGQLSGLSATYSMLACYSAFLCGLYYVLPLKVLKLSATSPNVTSQRVLDAVLVVCLLLAAILHVASSAVSDCSSKNEYYETTYGIQLFRCGDLSAAIVFTFITFALFLVTLVWSIARDSADSIGMDADAAAAGYTSATTPGASRANAYAVADSRHPALALVRRGGRVIQFVLALIIFICTLAGDKHYYSGRFMSPDAMFTILVSWSVMLYTLFHLVVVEIFKKSHRPSVGVERFMDALLAVLLLLAGILFAASHQVSNCSTINESYETGSGSLDGSNVLRCGSMKWAYVLAFIDFVFFLVTLAFSFCGSSDNQPAPDHVDVEAGQQV
ncbi:hypothetical protein BBJ28_00025128 [Nothophytophthora sp. Chile5]|nr:hypothetical protein BBJ28_00025128 [Nothophytophthora sp. Chile5]